MKVVFTVSGWARVRSPVGEVLLEPGLILTIPDGVECHGFPLGHTRTVTFYIEHEYLRTQRPWLPVTHPLARQLSRVLDGERRLLTLQLADTVMRELTPSLTRLAHVASEVTGLYAVLSMVLDVFDAVGRFAGTAGGKVEVDGCAPRREVLTAIALLQADLTRRWRIDDVAREVALSASQLTRVFRAQIGLSPAAFLRRLRADRMAELLTTTPLTISEAGAAVGWNDPSLASRLFKRRHGVPPSTYATFYARRRPR